MNSFLGFAGLRATTSFDQTLDLCPEKRPNSFSYFQQVDPSLGYL
ncbi:unnamed protein product [Brassica rapa subsp. trilocularis]